MEITEAEKMKAKQDLGVEERDFMEGKSLTHNVKSRVEKQN
jgi:hypothetical protein